MAAARAFDPDVSAPFCAATATASGPDTPPPRATRLTGTDSACPVRSSLVSADLRTTDELLPCFITTGAARSVTSGIDAPGTAVCSPAGVAAARAFDPDVSAPFCAATATESGPDVPPPRATCLTGTDSASSLRSSGASADLRTTDELFPCFITTGAERSVTSGIDAPGTAVCSPAGAAAARFFDSAVSAPFCAATATESGPDAPPPRSTFLTGTGSASPVRSSGTSADLRTTAEIPSCFFITGVSRSITTGIDAPAVAFCDVDGDTSARCFDPVDSAPFGAATATVSGTPALSPRSACFTGTDAVFSVRSSGVSADLRTTDVALSFSRFAVA